MTIPKQMIEAAAREFNRAVDSDDHTGGWDDISEQDRDFYREAASNAITAALATLWQPIEDAPKDGPAVLLSAPGPDSGLAMAFFDETWSVDGWWMLDDGACAIEIPLRGQEPTHFIDPSIFPLPTPKEKE